MNPDKFKSLTKRQQWTRIIVSHNKAIGDLEQLITDTNFYNGMPQMENEVPFDIEDCRVEIARLKKGLSDFIKQNPPESI